MMHFCNVYLFYVNNDIRYNMRTSIVTSNIIYKQVHVTKNVLKRTWISSSGFRVFEQIMHAFQKSNPTYSNDKKWTSCSTLGIIAFILQRMFGRHWYTSGRHRSVQPTLSSWHLVRRLCVVLTCDTILVFHISYMWLWKPCGKFVKYGVWHIVYNVGYIVYGVWHTMYNI